MCWNELLTPRPDLARAFYTGLFGWSIAAPSTSAHTTFLVDGAPRAGMLAMNASDGAGPSYWLVYFGVRDCEGQVALVQSLGGAVRVPPTHSSDGGRYAMLDDPQGATFAVVARPAAPAGGTG
jgi:predicted enzyme related to lactoylglutathione lyase